MILLVYVRVRFITYIIIAKMLMQFGNDEDYLTLLITWFSYLVMNLLEQSIAQQVLQLTLLLLNTAGVFTQANKDGIARD